MSTTQMHYFTDGSDFYIFTADGTFVTVTDSEERAVEYIALRKVMAEAQQARRLNACVGSPVNGYFL